MGHAGSSSLTIAAQHIFDGAVIAPGYRADLVAFNPSFEVLGTWIGGVGSTDVASEGSR